MPFARTKLARVVMGLLAAAVGWVPNCTHAAGVTVITHGNGGNTSGWVTGMANALSARLGGNIPIHRIHVGSGLTTATTKISGGNPLTSTNGEIIVLLDWGPVSSGQATTFQVAQTVAPLFTNSNLIAELAGHALAEFPIHLLGHSRGASLMCELSRELGARGIWVDQVTGLDAYPVGGDAPLASYENVLFADSYYQTAAASLLDGNLVPGSFWRRQTNVSGGYSFPYDGHSDVHLWYHGTIDLSPTASDTEAQFTSTMRNLWWNSGEQKGTNAGFVYARAGGGNRLSATQPDGVNSAAIRDGFNQRFDLGAGTSNNRTSVLFNTGEWPNVIQLKLISSDAVPHGEDAVAQIDFQWAQPVASNQTVQVFLDADRNPFNGNETLLLAGTASGTTSAQIGSGTMNVPVDATNAPPGSYRVFVKMTAAGRSRFAYAAGDLMVIRSSAAPWLDIAPHEGGGVVLGVNGVAGQSVVLEEAADFNAWVPVATNTLSSPRWELVLPGGESNAFYRALLAP